MPGPKHPNAHSFVKRRLFHELTSFGELEARLLALPTKQDRGNAFEVFAEAYLATQSIAQARQVWPCQTTPPSILKRLALDTRRDMGVDGVLQTTRGEFNAYQVKFRSGRPSLTWDELSTFMGLADKVGQRVLFTNCNDLPALMKDRGNFYCIRGNDLDRLEPRDFEALLRWLESGIVVEKKKEPMPHQREALGNILPALETNDRVTAIMACGTGKTLVALWVAENVVAERGERGSNVGTVSVPRPDSTVLVLVPSLALLRQTLHEWLKETRWENVAYLCVCSDPSVQTDADDLVVRQSDLDFPVTTDSNVVRQFLSKDLVAQASLPVKIVFSTYHSADVVAAGMVVGHVPSRGESGKAPDGGIGPTAFDLGIFDEAHKTAGREGLKFSFALKDENLPIKKRLFVTATPRHYDIRKRDKEGDAVLVYSMDNPAVYGPVAHKLTFAEAARRGIICNYKVIISVVTSQMINDELLRHGEVIVGGESVKARQVANQIALKEAIGKFGVRKIFTFHRSVASAKSFTSDSLEGIGQHLNRELGTANREPSFQCFHVNGTMLTAYRESLMSEFRAAENAIISNAKCLTEGVDVPAVDMVAFLTPKRSRVDIVQATGRAMRKAKGKNTGYVLVPLFVEQATGERLEAAIERTEFDEVWAVLQAMQEQDEALDDSIQFILAGRKRIKGFDESRIRERVEIIGPTISINALRKAIATKCITRLGRPWDVMVQQLLLFKKKSRHLRVPKDVAPPWKALGQWVDNVRALKRNGNLTSEREAQLNALRFEWRVDGQTLDDTKGLLIEHAFARQSGFTTIGQYRKKGLIRPVGFAPAGGSTLSAYYRPSQLGWLKKKLGITLEHTKGLLLEDQIRGACGVTRIANYRKARLIKPLGWGWSSGGVVPFYHPRQIEKLRKELGITLVSTKGLISHGEVRVMPGLSAISSYRKRGLIKPIGYAPRPGLANCAFYHPRQIAELKKKLGWTLKDTHGLLNTSQVKQQLGFNTIAKYRALGMIKPIGYAHAGSVTSAFYHPKQIKALKKRLGATLTNTRGLLNEMQFKKATGLAMVAEYRERGLIKPAGKDITTAGLSYFYHPRQIEELRRKLGITLNDTTGLLNENQFKKRSGITVIHKYRKTGLIKPVGSGMTAAGISAFYRPRQIEQLKKALGITLGNTRGLLSERQFRMKSGLSRVERYRQLGLIKPHGFAMGSNGVNPYYHPRQTKELREKLGITLNDITGLLNESRFADKCGLSRITIDKSRKRGLLKPVGRAMAGPGLSYFYHPSQTKELKQKLVTLRNAKAAKR